MGTPQEEATFFAKAASALPRALQQSLYIEANELKSLVQERTPVRSGRLRAAWSVRKPRGSDLMATISIYNENPYASVLEFGLDPSEYPQHPWARSLFSRKGGETKLRRKRSKATKAAIGIKDGKIYSKAAMGGMAAPITGPAYQQQLARKLADIAVEVFR